MTQLNIKDSSSNPSYLNFNGTAKEVNNQELTPAIGTVADIYKNFIVLESPIILDDTIYYLRDELI